MFKDRMEGANVTKGAIIVGGNAPFSFEPALGNGLAKREGRILVVAKVATFTSQFTNSVLANS